MVNPRGRVCRCGSRGCWETEIGSSAVARALKVDSGVEVDLAERLAEVSRPSAGLRTVGRYLGLGLASIVNVLNPEVVVLGGMLRSLYPVVRDEADAVLETSALTAPFEQVRVVVPALGGDAVLVGAAEKAFEAVLADPAGVLATACRDARAALGTAPRRRAAVATDTKVPVQAKASVPA
ncbi:hypothetical protein GCM10025868_05240 [Angustibacter aerolatus]|uniref:ROK family protein n=1 Tax=Angustibacter aerolatus TaxID=1162965 RepID=A0ABQ6JBV3_9ACTN|nr:ROK family protein [Angustibacter aerolatus]GMA85274.1 hypothetical protein GCM10025868_05240 [Angustibacter aerolatus]